MILNAVFDCNRLDQAGCYLVLSLCFFCKLGGQQREGLKRLGAEVWVAS